MADKKVIVHLSGGLGNQMFQYMAGACLAKKSGHELVINLNWFSNPVFRNKGNPAYSTKRKADILQFQAVARTKVDWLPTPRDGRMERLVSILNSSIGEFLGVTSEINFTPPESESVSKTKRLFGFFMSPKFFSDVDSKPIFAELSPPLTKWSLEMQEILKVNDSIGVHIRLGDYVSLGDKVIPTEDYFLKGIEQLLPILGLSSKIYLFTDEPKRLREMFPSLASRGEIISPPNYTTSAENLIVLSSCRAFVCSNSTFSWWGAALSNASDSLVVRPSYFYTDKPFVDSHADLWGSTAISLHPLTGDKA